MDCEYCVVRCPVPYNCKISHKKIKKVRNLFPEKVFKEIPYQRKAQRSFSSLTPPSTPPDSFHVGKGSSQVNGDKNGHIHHCGCSGQDQKSIYQCSAGLKFHSKQRAVSGL